MRGIFRRHGKKKKKLEELVGPERRDCEEKCQRVKRQVCWVKGKRLSYISSLAGKALYIESKYLSCRLNVDPNLFHSVTR